jgi:LysM repeat protein
VQVLILFRMPYFRSDRANPGRWLSRRIIAGVALPAAALVALPPGWAPHRIVRGDTLWGLARSHHTSVSQLKQVNHLTTSVIRSGDLLLLPGAGASTSAPTSPTSRAAAAAPATATTSYLVHRGDTLSAIARRAHSSVSVLARLNHLSGRMTIYAGKRLLVPAPPRPRTVSAAAAADRAALASVSQPSRSQIAAMVRAEAARQGVDPALALAIATAESSLDQRAVSYADAVGVMQLMPYTATWLSSLEGRPLDRMQAADNIRGGVLLLRFLTRAADLKTAIAGYYQGLASVRAHGMRADTKAYLSRVLALRSGYR